MRKMNKKGISLIVLVITIIVMIIIAGAVVISLGSSGIINQANAATAATDLMNIKTIADAAWGDAYASGARTRTEIKAIMQERLRGVDLENYLVKVTPDGVVVTRVSKNGGIVVEPYLNEYGFYYDYPYAVRMYNENTAEQGITGLGLIFHENGSAEICILSTMVNNLFISLPMELVLGSDSSSELEFRYVDNGVAVYQINKDTGEEKLNTTLNFAENGTKLDLGEDAPAGLEFKCEFNGVHEIYRDVEYRGIGVLDDNTINDMMDLRMTYSSDDILTYENRTTGQSQSIRAKLLYNRFLVAVDTETDDMELSDIGSFLGIVTLDGEHIIVPFEEGEEELGNMAILKKMAD